MYSYVCVHMYKKTLQSDFKKKIRGRFLWSKTTKIFQELKSSLLVFKPFSSCKCPRLSFYILSLQKGKLFSIRNHFAINLASCWSMSWLLIVFYFYLWPKVLHLQALKQTWLSISLKGPIKNCHFFSCYTFSSPSVVSRRFP